MYTWVALLITQASVGKPSHKMQAVVGRQNGGHGPRCSMRREWKLGTRVRQLVLSCTRSSLTNRVTVHKL